MLKLAVVNGCVAERRYLRLPYIYFETLVVYNAALSRLRAFSPCFVRRLCNTLPEHTWKLLQERRPPGRLALRKPLLHTTDHSWCVCKLYIQNVT